MEMINRENINKLINSMTENSSTNVKKIKKLFGTLDYKDSECQSILHILVDNNYNEKKCFLAIKSLLDFGVNPNLKDDFDYIFIQTALYTGYSEDFICDIIKESLKYKLNVNHVDSDGDTIIIPLPENFETGTYNLRIIAEDDNANYYSEVSKEISYINTNQPTAPTISNTSNAGDYKVSFEVSDDGEEFDGYIVNA